MRPKPILFLFFFQRFLCVFAQCALQVLPSQNESYANAELCAAAAAAVLFDASRRIKMHLGSAAANVCFSLQRTMAEGP